MSLTQEINNQYTLTAPDGRTVGQNRIQVIPLPATSNSSDPSIQSLFQLPDFGSAVVGGSRGYGAIDLQGMRNTAAQVAGNKYSVVLGSFNAANNHSTNGYGGIAIGISNVSNGTTGGIAIGMNNSATGNTKSVAIGHNCSATGDYSLAAGTYSTAGEYGAIAAGYGCNASGRYATAIGSQNTASGLKSLAIGSHTLAGAAQAIAVGTSATSNAPWGMAVNRGVVSAEGQMSFAFGQTAAWRFGEFAMGGTADQNGQPGGTSVIPMEITTTNNTPTDLICGGANNGSLFTTSKCKLLPADGTLAGTMSKSLHAFKVVIAAFNIDGSEAAMFVRTGLIKMYDGTAALVGSIQTIGTDINTPALSVSITADNTNKALKITVTGANSKTYQWRATVYASVILLA